MSKLNVLLFGAAATLMATSAFAADLPARRAAPVPYAAPPAFTWTGFYLGVNAGAAFGNNTRPFITRGPDFVGVVDSTASAFGRLHDESSFTGGGQIGYNQQFGSFVAGVEADINYLDLRTRRTASTTIADFGFAGLPGFSGSETLTSRNRIDWFGTVRGRLGFLPTEQLMVYATGGLAYANVETRLNYVGTGSGFGTTLTFPYAGSRSEMKVGYALGGGLEYALTQNVSIKGEYLYVDLGRDTVRANLTIPGTAGDYLSSHEKSAFSVARLGLNWKFNTFGF